MTHTHQPDQPATSYKVPMCAACGKMMRLHLAQPSSRYINLDEYTFRCDCGEAVEHFVARKN